MRLDLLPGPAPSTPPPPPPPPKDSQNPNDRATTFQAVEGGEQHSGAVLLVEAYAAIWLFLLGFVLLQWMKQAKLHARLDELEKVVDRAADKLEKESAQAKQAKVGENPFLAETGAAPEEA
jgi:CcmD family protein